MHGLPTFVQADRSGQESSEGIRRYNNDKPVDDKLFLVCHMQHIKGGKCKHVVVRCPSRVYCPVAGRFGGFGKVRFTILRQTTLRLCVLNICMQLTDSKSSLRPPSLGACLSGLPLLK